MIDDTDKKKLKPLDCCCRVQFGYNCPCYEKCLLKYPV